MAQEGAGSTAAQESVAIVHDYLNQRGGAERVALELARMWPEASIYTSLYRSDMTFPEFAERRIRTSYLDRLPVRHGFRNLFPLYPSAFRGFGTLKESLVVSTTSGWAHGVRTRSDSTHAVYCHTPARWLYGYAYLGAGSTRQRLARPALRALRRWDLRAARRADLYIANSQNVRRRIRAEYGLDADVVHPPVDVDRFTPRPRGERLLVVSRLLPYKRVDLAIEAANRSGLPLDVIGSGPAYRDLRELAGPGVEFHRRLDDATVTEMMEGCRALVLCGEEDFGITPVEAMAAGKPVVAFAAGGALETLEDGVSAAFFREPTPEHLLEALRRADAMDLDHHALAAAARRFSPEAFRGGIRDAIARVHGAGDRRRADADARSPDRGADRAAARP